MNQSDWIILEALSKHIREKIGIYFPEKKYSELLNKLSELKKEYGFNSLEGLADHIINEESNKELVNILAKKFTIGETYFWRDRGMFRILEETILPELIEKKRNTKKEIRIWSAAAATGEEAYSIGILLQRLIPDLNDWNITILATDINQTFLEKAREGIYTEWSFRSAPHWLKKDYFIQNHEKKFELASGIKKMVTFTNLNLVQDPYPSLSNNTNGMDLIFCRNVLIYFSLDDIKRISDNLYNCLIEDGLLLTTPSESFHYLSPRYKTKHLGEVTVYQRKTIIKQEPENPPRKLPVTPPPIIRQKKTNRPLQIKQEKPLAKRTATKPAEPRYDDAQNFYSTGEYIKAEAILENIINGHSNNETLMLMARTKANIGKLDEAKKFCQLSIEKNKLCPKCYYLQAMIEAELGNTQAAYDALKKSFYLDSSFVITNFTLGKYAGYLEKHNESEKHFRNTIDLLEKMKPEDLVPESDGMTAGRLKEIILETTVI